MALNSRQKRAAVIGTARIWYRNPHPSSLDAAQRAAVGQGYPVALFTIPIVPAVGRYLNLSQKSRTISLTEETRAATLAQKTRSVELT